MSNQDTKYLCSYWWNEKENIDLLKENRILLSKIQRLLKDNKAVLQENDTLLKENQILTTENKKLKEESILTGKVYDFTTFKRCLLYLKRLCKIKEMVIDGRDFDRLCYEIYKQSEDFYYNSSKLGFDYNEPGFDYESMSFYGILIKKEIKN